MTNEILQRRMEYLNARLQAGRGNQAVLVREIVKAFNARQDRRRATDLRVCGWRVVHPPFDDQGYIRDQLAP